MPDGMPVDVEIVRLPDGREVCLVLPGRGVVRAIAPASVYVTPKPTVEHTVDYVLGHAEERAEGLLYRIRRWRTWRR